MVAKKVLGIYFFLFLLPAADAGQRNDRRLNYIIY